MKIALGTVQFGLDYGISNKQGQTCVQQASDILEYAHQNEVNFLDTATSYGNSEEMLGRIKCTQDWNIVTKTPNFNTQSIVSLDVENLRESFEQSLVKLKRKNIYGLLVHDSDDLFKPGGGKLFREMDSIRSSGRVSKIGVSVYNSEQFYKILGEYDFDIIQLPINILDQRLIETGVLKKIKKYDIEVHARSVFLQGLLLMSIDNIPPYFFPIKKKLENFIKKTKELSMSRLELALAFVQSIDEIDKVIVGVNTLEQLSEVINASRTQIRFSEFSDLAVDNQDFIDPTRWRV